MISQTVEYALRAMVILARHDALLRSSRDIARAIDVPSPYLAKVMQGLVRAGLLRSRRGVNGGFTITKDPAELTVWDVVQAVDPIQRIRRCPLNLDAHSGQLCPLHRRLDEALEGVETIFQETTLAELVAHEGRTSPLCATGQRS